MEQIVQETHDFKNLNDVTLLQELNLHSEPDSEEIFVLKLQKVQFLKTDSSLSWVYLEAEDGQTGWFKMSDSITIYENVTYHKVFEGLLNAG